MTLLQAETREWERRRLAVIVRAGQKRILGRVAEDAARRRRAWLQLLTRKS